MRKDTKNWIESSAYDMETARQMFKTARYLYVIFMCHLAIEKMLKACVAEKTQQIPAKTHDLIYLVSKTELKLSNEYLDFIGRVNNVSIPTRYPEDIKKMMKDYTKEIAMSYLEDAENLIKWLRKQIT